MRIDLDDADQKLETFFNEMYHKFSNLYEEQVMMIEDDLPAVDPGQSKLHTMLLGVSIAVLNHNPTITPDHFIRTLRALEKDMVHHGD